MAVWSPEFCEREYNARAAVPEHGAIFARWDRQAAEARRRHAAILDLAYGETPLARLDFFPTAVRNAPLLTFIHGGYWRSLDKRDFSWIAPPFVARGINVALLNYELLPGVALEDIVRQMLAAHAWLYRRADTYAFDRHAIFASGHSAGGHLAAMLLAALWPQYASDLPADLLRGGISVSGLYDLEPLRHTPSVQGDLALDAEGARRLSPGAMPGPAGMPLIVCAGGDESAEFRRQAHWLEERWPQTAIARVEAPGRNHYTICDAFAEPGHPLHAAAVALIQRR